MYLKFFNLNSKPFTYITPNPRFFYYAPQYLNVKRKADYIVSERSGHLYIYGPIGSGKTTLLKTIAQTLSEDETTIVNFLNAPKLKTANALVRRISEGFEVKTERRHEATLKNLTNWLIAQHGQERFPVLVIDEAQNIVRDGLKAIHYLMMYVTSEEMLVMVVLCGQEELASRIDRYPEIKSRMYPLALTSLSREEVEELVRYRWSVANATKDNPLPFQKESLDSIFEYSKGLPRQVCKICDMALLAAFADDSKAVNSEIIHSVAEGLDLVGGKHGR